jgi:hypothetical protein
MKKEPLSMLQKHPENNIQNLPSAIILHKLSYHFQQCPQDAKDSDYYEAYSTASISAHQLLIANPTEY